MQMAGAGTTSGAVSGGEAAGGAGRSLGSDTHRLLIQAWLGLQTAQVYESLTSQTCWAGLVHRTRSGGAEGGKLEDRRGPWPLPQGRAGLWRLSLGGPGGSPWEEQNQQR